MRQAGCFAAAGLVALETMVERLDEDHQNARLLATELAKAGFPVKAERVETNMVYVDVPENFMDATHFVAALRDAGILVNPPKGSRVRMVTHYGITAEDVRNVGTKIRGILKGAL